MTCSLFCPVHPSFQPIYYCSLENIYYCGLENIYYCGLEIFASCVPRMFFVPPDFAKILEARMNILTKCSFKMFSVAGDFAGTCEGAMNISMRSSLKTFTGSVKMFLQWLAVLMFVQVFFCNWHCISQEGHRDEGVHIYQINQKLLQYFQGKVGANIFQSRNWWGFNAKGFLPWQVTSTHLWGLTGTWLGLTHMTEQITQATHAWKCAIQMHPKLW